MTNEFNTLHQRANDHPNAFKLALRMATALSTSPKQVDGRWAFTIDAPIYDPNYPIARDLLRAALKKVDQNRYFGWEVEQGRGKETGKFIVKTPYISRGNLPVARPELPTREISHHLRRIQDALSCNWVKDDDGNYRHSHAFTKYGAAALEEYHCIDPSKFSDLLCELLPESNVSDTRLFDPRISDFDALPALEELPKSAPLESSGHTIGLCLTEEQVNTLAKAIGFKSPVRSK